MRVSKAKRKRDAAFARRVSYFDRDLKSVLESEKNRCERNAWKVRQFEARFRGFSVE